MFPCWPERHLGASCSKVFPCWPERRLGASCSKVFPCWSERRLGASCSQVFPCWPERQLRASCSKMFPCWPERRLWASCSTSDRSCMLRRGHVLENELFSVGLTCLWTCFGRKGFSSVSTAHSLFMHCRQNSAVTKILTWKLVRQLCPWCPGDCCP